jgi:hypothetical protein
LINARGPGSESCAIGLVYEMKKATVETMAFKDLLDGKLKLIVVSQDLDLFFRMILDSLDNQLLV